MNKVMILGGLICLVIGNVNAEEIHLNTPKAIEQHVKPIGQIDVQENKVSVGNPKGASSGKEIYDQYCTICHTSGAAGAPKLGDQAAWKPRISQGKETLYQHVLQGYKMMPPKGTCLTCSDEDIKKTVDYIIGEGSKKK